MPCFQTVITERCDQSDARTADLEKKLNSLANQIASSTVSSSNTSLTVSNNSTQASTSSDMERIQHGGYHLRRNELDKLGLPYYCKQGYYPTVEEVLELERYLMHSRLVIGFHPITMDDILKMENEGWSEEMALAAAAKHYWKKELGFTEEECVGLDKDQDAWCLRTHDTVFIRFKDQRLVDEL